MTPGRDAVREPQSSGNKTWIRCVCVYIYQHETETMAYVRHVDQEPRANSGLFQDMLIGI